MRTIKFRAWHKRRKKYYEVLQLHLDSHNGCWATAKGFCVIEQKDIYIQIQPEDCIIEEFTGLLDKNGVEIFEGDILAGSNGSLNGMEWPHEPTEVTFKDGVFRVPEWGTFKNFNRTHYIEVIGNINQNPELLEVSG